jgi:quinoprotein dehydrogenase-associated probable ABC transporter substrate-binding protein
MRGIQTWIVAACVVALCCGATSAHAQTGELVDRDTLRVCADPHNLPFSNQAGEGFENRIAELLAQELGLQLAYTWYPQSVGFVRNTLGAHACDVVIGTVTAGELLQNTNPYYRSSYALVQRADAKIKADALTDPQLADLRIGAVARTPPIDILAQQGLLKNVTPYALVVDTRYDSPGRDMVEDVAAGKIDVGVLWGPIAGYWAKQASVPIEVIPLTGENARARMDFRIAMGLRRNEPEWKQVLNDFIAKHKADIQTILLDYGVPLLDEQGHQIKAALDTRQGALERAPAAHMSRVASMTERSVSP